MEDADDLDGEHDASNLSKKPTKKLHKKNAKKTQKNVLLLRSNMQQRNQDEHPADQQPAMRHTLLPGMQSLGNFPYTTKCRVA